MTPREIDWRTEPSKFLDWISQELRFTDGTETWPFVEDENANITGYSHQDVDEFAAAINRYDEVCNGAPIPAEDKWTGADIAHLWAVPEFDANGEWRLRRAASDAPGAIPVTTLWGQR